MASLILTALLLYTSWRLLRATLRGLRRLGAGLLASLAACGSCGQRWAQGVRDRAAVARLIAESGPHPYARRVV